MAHYGNDNTKIQGTPIQTFYANQSILITGGTGLFGKILIEKLLRSCPDINKIYMIIRSKKNKSATTRLNEFFENSLFVRVKTEMPNFRDKVVPLVQIGELYEEGLGLTKDDVNLVTSKVSIVFHLAANIRFNENIKAITKVNVYGTRAILDLAKRMPNLKSFIYVSSITCNFNKAAHIEEKFYECPISLEEFNTLIQTSSESTINEKILRIAAQWPNTYAFTKAITEVLIRDSCESLPVGIFRSSAVINTAREPLVGWIDNYYGPIGIVVPFSKGLTRFVTCNSDGSSNFVPVDITINSLIAAAWDVFNQSHRRGEKILIYNSVSANDAPLSYGDYFAHAQLNVQKYPMKECYWLPTLVLVRNRIIYTICIWLGHLLPALFIDIFQKCTSARQSIWKSYSIIHGLNNVFDYFLLNSWTYSDDNIQAMWQSMNKNDQFLFDFNMKGFDWPKYLEDHFKGIRRYLLKDDFSTLEASRIKWKRLYWIYQVTKMVFIFIGAVLVWKLFADILF